MDLLNAVQLAKNGEDAGFNYLYEKTYQSKYYLALKYVKDEELAKDVLQESYLKAFSKLDTLQEPEKFSAWLGMIVANTAQNVLKKKNPMSFADVTADEGEGFELEIEDEHTNLRPETAYTQKETVELVHELIGTLSEEQKMCIIMYHIEGLSISEIAETLGCSENTVKSRLVYGRNNIKTKAEELQKKGHQLYTVAPIAIIIYLLTKEEEFLAADGTLEAAKGLMPKATNTNVANASTEAGQKAMTEAARTVGTAAVKKGFLATVAGKITVAAVALCVVGAVAVGAMTLTNNDEPAGGNADTEDSQDIQNSEDVQETETEEAPVSFDVTDDMYSELLVGGISKEQFGFVLGYGPKEMSNGEVDVAELRNVMMIIKEQGSYGGECGLTSEGYTDDYSYVKFKLEDVNNLFSVLGGFGFTEADNATLTSGTAKVEGDAFLISAMIPDSNFKYETTIRSARVEGDVMTVEYHVAYSVSEDGEPMRVVTEYNLVATLTKTPDGLFQVTEIKPQS